MLAQAMAELMPVEELEDVLVYKNPKNENMPIIRVVKTYPTEDYLKKHPYFMKYYSKPELEAVSKYSKTKEHEKIADTLKLGLGRRIVETKEKTEKAEQMKLNPLVIIGALAVILFGIIFFADVDENVKWLVIAAVFGLGFLYVISNATSGLARKLSPFETAKPKLIIDNSRKKHAPFIDATGSKAGALLGDVKHDPLQSGGLGTPAHTRVEGGAVHSANKGVLFIDEIASLKMNWQQELLTAMQEKKYAITGQSEHSSGALVKTQPAPTDFVLVAAGNLPDLKQIHPALRSRIRGAGYEVYVEDTMDVNEKNKNKLIQFVAQEVKKDKKIPHFTKEAVEEIIEETRRRSGRRNKFTLNLREIGGLIRAAGDIAEEAGKKYVEREDLLKARKVFSPLEMQLGKKIIDMKKEYQLILNEGEEVGRVNGLAVLGDSQAGLVLPIVAEITPASSKEEGKVIATGKLGTIAKEAVSNVSAIIKKYIGKDISQKDIHVQFLQTYEGVEGDSASISIAVAVISALEDIPVKQSFAMTGSLDVRGEVLPIGGVNAKIEAAIESGIHEVIVPESNFKDIYLPKEKKDKVKVHKVKNIVDVLSHVFEDSKKKALLIKKLKKQFK
ncbi:ATP-dependent protease LonB [Candidatus Micrarchaeota archaeon]|nr:ATP-dependent protease LonB [Candidatus Micrarchaeota archaeon]